MPLVCIKVKKFSLVEIFLLTVEYVRCITYAHRMTQRTIKPAKKRTTISISKVTHARGVKLAQMERRDFSGMLENAIDERWAARQAQEAGK